MSKYSPKFLDLVRKTRQTFLAPFDIDTPEFVETLRSLATPYNELGAAFRYNLRSIVTMVSIPFVLASTSVNRQHFIRINMATRLRARADAIERTLEETESKIESEEQLDKKALTTAKNEFEKFLQTDEGRDTITHDICHFLLEAHKEDELASSVSELLLQGTALTWGAFEILARDVFIAYLNKTPDAVSKLIENPNVRQKYDLPKVSVQDLAAHGFDLSSSMGTLLSKQKGLTDLPTIKIVYSALFPPPTPFIERLNESDLWILSQQRHLIMHHRGIVDERFKTNTKSNESIGARLMVRPRELERHLMLVRDVGRALLELVTIKPIPLA